MINVILSCIFLFLADNVLSADRSIEKPDELFQMLHNNDGWNRITTQDDITLSTKNINDMSLVAFMVQQRTSIPTAIIQEIVMDVKNYGNYFNSTGPFIFKEMNRKNDWVDGYHLLPIDLPIIKDREYFFRVRPTGYKPHDNTSIVHWYLIKNGEYDNKAINKNHRDTIYLDYGAGLWTAEPLDDGRYILSYRLYLDPGGSIPDFAIELMNKISIVNIFKDVIQEATRRNITVLP